MLTEPELTGLMALRSRLPEFVGGGRLKPAIGFGGVGAGYAGCCTGGCCGAWVGWLGGRAAGYIVRCHLRHLGIQYCAYLEPQELL